MREDINPKHFMLFIFTTMLVMCLVQACQPKEPKQVQHITVGKSLCAVGEDCNGNVFIHKLDTVTQ